MIRLRLGATELRVHVLALLAVLLALRLGLRAELLAALPALGAHEAGHLLAARALGVPVLRLDLMPFGASMQIESLYALDERRLLAVALAGPLANLILLTACAALAWAGALGPIPATLLVRANLVLMLFNLLPALPLDGGRALYALAAPLIGEKRALMTGAVFGAALGALLAVSAAVGVFRGGRLNLTLLLAAVFLVAGGFQEGSARREGVPYALFRAYGRSRKPHRLRLVALDADETLLRAARTLRAGEENLYALFDADRFAAWLDQPALLDALERGMGKGGSLREYVRPEGGVRSAERRA